MKSQARWFALALPGLLLAAPVRADVASSWPAKLDPRLLADVVVSSPEPVAVWLSFVDKGEQGPADLVARLSEAEAALTPRARARRLRAQVRPLVNYDDLPVHPGYLAELERRGLVVVAQSRWLNRAAVRVPAARLEELAGLPWIARIAPVERARLSADPPRLLDGQPPASSAAPARREDATSLSISYGLTQQMLQQINVPAVHDSGYIGTGVLACILDDGFHSSDQHVALRTVPIAPGMRRDFVDGDTVLTDSPGGGSLHGTWVFGVIGANLQGSYVGSGFGAQFALARTEKDLSETPVEMLYWGMGAEWADSLGADLITSSLGYFTFDNPAYNYTYSNMDGRTTDVSRAAEIAASKGILMVNAVGNEGTTAWHYLIAPADVRTDSLIAVGAVDPTGASASFSSYGPNAAGCVKPDLAALGVSNPLVNTADPNGYFALSGTSFATPLVAGLAACLLQARPTWAPTTIARALRETASQSATPDNRVGWGIPNGLAALRWDPGVAGVPGPSTGFGLRLVGPNPMHRAGGPLQFQFGLGASHDGAHPTRIRVFDARGRVVREVFSGMVDCDQTVVSSWDGRDREGRYVQSGIYFVTLESRGLRQGARLIVLP